MLKLISDQTETWVVEKTFNIGSDVDNHLVLDDPSVAPFHARIVFDGKHYLLKDLTSPAGTYVNQQRVNQRQIHDTDELRFGDRLLRVVDPILPGNQPHWCLVASSGWLSGHAYPLISDPPKTTFKIGRGSQCDIVFPGTHLAREHLALEIKDGFVHARSLRSGEDIFINDECVDSGELLPGDTLRLDVHSFKLYGPGRHPAGANLSSENDQLAIIPTSPPNTVGEAEKRWITRPTSPGNRADAMSQNHANESFIIKLVVAVALFGFLGLGLYLWMG